MEESFPIRLGNTRAKRLLKLPARFCVSDLIGVGYSMNSAYATIRYNTRVGVFTSTDRGFYRLSEEAQAALAKYRLPPGEQLQFGFCKEAQVDIPASIDVVTDRTTGGTLRLFNKLKNRKLELELELSRIEDYIRDLSDSSTQSVSSKQTDIIFPDLTEQEEEQLAEHLEIHGYEPKEGDPYESAESEVTEEVGTV